jgi:uncharacterized protein YbjT (DUF2867 family)
LIISKLYILSESPNIIKQQSKNSKNMKILVYGATGSQQSPVIEALLSLGHQVRATTHSAEKIALLNQKGVEGFMADMADYDVLLAANEGIDAVSLLVPFFLANPSDGLTYAKNAIDAAIANNVPLLVWNTSGFIPPAKIGNPSIDVRVDILEYLQKSTLPHIIIQPSVYAENLLGPWTAPFVMNDDKVAYPTPEKMQIGWIATKDVAALVAQALVSPHLVGSSFLVSGIENLDGTQLAEAFSKGLNRKIQFYPMQPSVFGDILDKIFGEGAGKGAAAEYQKLADTGVFPVMHTPMQDVLQKLPVKMTSIKSWVEQNAANFTKK